MPRNLRRFQMSRSLVNFPGDNAKHAPDRVPREAHGAGPRFKQLRVQHRQQRRAADLGGQVPSPACRPHPSPCGSTAYDRFAVSVVDQQHGGSSERKSPREKNILPWALSIGVLLFDARGAPCSSSIPRTANSTRSRPYRRLRPLLQDSRSRTQDCCTLPCSLW